MRGRAGAANRERERRRARQGGGGGALFQGRASAALSGGAERSGRRAISRGRRSSRWREAERGRPGKLGRRIAARALGPGLREQEDTAAAAAAAAGRAQGTPPLPALCFSPALLSRGLCGLACVTVSGGPRGSPRPTRPRLRRSSCVGWRPRSPPPGGARQPVVRGGLWGLGSASRQCGWRGFGHAAAPPAAATTLRGVLPATRSSGHSGVSPGLAGEGGGPATACGPGGRRGGGCVLIPQVLPSGVPAL